MNRTTRKFAIKQEYARQLASRAAIHTVIGLVFLLQPSSFAHTQDFRALGQLVLEAEDEIANRPLFSPSRRPPSLPPMVEVALPAETQSPEPVVQQDKRESLRDWQLVGILKASDQRTALVRDMAQKEVFTISVGESRNEWVLTEVSGRRAVFRNGEISASIGYVSDGKGN